MMRQATRIRDRAIRRAGELLKQVEPSSGGRPPETRADSRPSYSRKEAATTAGFSPHQAKQAVRVANVPEADFERQVESRAHGALVSVLCYRGSASDQGRRRRSSRSSSAVRRRIPREGASHEASSYHRWS